MIQKEWNEFLSCIMCSYSNTGPNGTSRLLTIVTNILLWDGSNAFGKDPGFYIFISNLCNMFPKWEHMTLVREITEGKLIQNMLCRILKSNSKKLHSTLWQCLQTNSKYLTIVPISFQQLVFLYHATFSFEVTHVWYIIDLAYLCQVQIGISGDTWNVAIVTHMATRTSIDNYLWWQ